MTADQLAGDDAGDYFVDLEANGLARAAPLRRDERIAPDSRN